MSNPTLQDLPEKDTWQTPPWLYEGIADPLGGFDLDPCAGPQTRIADHNYSIQRGEDGLSRDWFGDVWVNPPFTDKNAWLDKAVREHNENHDVTRVFVLTPDSTDVKSWFHGSVVPNANYVWFSEGRIKFLDPETRKTTGQPSFGTAVSVFGEIPNNLIGWFNEYGWLVETANQTPVTTYNVTD